MKKQRRKGGRPTKSGGGEVGKVSASQMGGRDWGRFRIRGGRTYAEIDVGGREGANPNTCADEHDQRKDELRKRTGGIDGV